MPKATLLLDAKRLADTVASVGGVVPDVLANLLAAHALLSSPGSSQAPETAILDHALKGTLDQRSLDKLLPAAATARMVNEYRGDLARRAEHVVVGQWHRELEAGAADQILDSLRGSFDRHAEAIATARSLFTAESTAEHVLASGQKGTIEAWQSLDSHLKVISKIGAVASAFGPMMGSFPQIVPYANADGFRLADAAIICSAGDLVTDSALFGRPDQGHRTSPWARVTLKLYTVESAKDRYRQWAATEWDRVHSGPQESWIDERGHSHKIPKPENPYKARASVT